jgi:hypothetical protein
MMNGTTALAAISLLAVATTMASARPATVSDFATCNQEASAAVGGSALPGPATPVSPLLAPGSGGMAGGTDSSGKIVTGSRDPLLEGMDAGQAGHPGYRAAYRDCMGRQGITGPPAS